MTDRLTDVGAQAERTALSWQRTGLSAVAVGAVLVHAHPPTSPLPPWPGLLLIAAGAFAAGVLAPLRYRRVLRDVRSGRTPASAATVLGLTVAVAIVLAGSGAAIVLG